MQEQRVGDQPERSAGTGAAQQVLRYRAPAVAELWGDRKDARQKP